VILNAANATAGADAGGTVWFDNVQVWDQTTTGQTSMPYCELRFPQSPAQLVISGIQGDLPTPALAAFGTYVTSLGNGSTLTFYLGRRAQAHAATVLVENTWLDSGGYPQLDTTSYGGWTVVTPSGASAATLYPLSRGSFNGGYTVAAVQGTYHYLTRTKTSQTAANIGNITVNAYAVDGNNAVYDNLYSIAGSTLKPITSSNTWTPADTGQVQFPLSPAGGILGSPALPTSMGGPLLAFPSATWWDATSGGSTFTGNWGALLPVDGGVLAGTVINPTGGGVNQVVSNSWLWGASDPLLVPPGGPCAWRYMEYRDTSGDPALALPPWAFATGGAGAMSDIRMSINPAADPYLILDPSLSTTTTQVNAGVNQGVGLVADQNGAIYSWALEVQYSPLYLYPR
jgi:hypothetical protein